MPVDLTRPTCWSNVRVGPRSRLITGIASAPTLSSTPSANGSASRSSCTRQDPKKRAWCRAERVEPEKPYLERNHNIVDRSDVLLATPVVQVGEQLRSGTWATVRYARKRGKRVIVVRPDGSRQDEGGKEATGA